MWTWQCDFSICGVYVIIKNWWERLLSIYCTYKLGISKSPIVILTASNRWSRWTLLDIQIDTNKDKHHKTMHPCMVSDLRMSCGNLLKKAGCSAAVRTYESHLSLPVCSCFVMFSHGNDERVIFYLSISVPLTQNTSRQYSCKKKEYSTRLSV